METLYMLKKQRALDFLHLRYARKTLTEIALILKAPLSTIQKHDNALKRLSGELGEYKQEAAYEALHKFSKGRTQTDSVTNLTDHKMVSDLVAMQWAVHTWCTWHKAEEAKVEKHKAALKKTKAESDVIELRIRSKFRGPIHTVSEALDELLGLPSTYESHPYLSALNDLIESIIELEETLMS
jgi:hypothetical protein